MSVDPRLLEILVCTACHGKVRPVTDAGLECVDCGRIYPIRDGIPVMLIDEASAPTRGPGDEPPRT
jgi:uncharacterized protein YbaR (Trm112 family)